MKSFCCGLALLVTCTAHCFAQYKYDAPKTLTVAEAIELVNSPASGFANMSPFELQVHYRMALLQRYHKYRYEEAHAAAWKKALESKEQTEYGKVCAAYFLLDQDRDARTFIEGKLASKDLRQRYNAAEMMRMRIGGGKARDWEVDAIIALLKDGGLDGSGVTHSPRGEFPDGDRDDIIQTPIDRICRTIGRKKVIRAVPALISVLERKPEVNGASEALGELQDKRAIPALMKTLENADSVGGELFALAEFKHKDAVPLIVARLGRANPGPFGDPNSDLLEALLQIGDRSALPAIEKYLESGVDDAIKRVGRRVQVQLAKDNPAPGLLALYDQETDEYEQWKLIDALAKYGGPQVRAKLEKIANESLAYNLRLHAVWGLSTMGDRQSLLILASLLEIQLPRDIQGGWKIANHQTDFVETIEGCLELRCKVKLGRDRAAWEKWIQENVKS